MQPGHRPCGYLLNLQMFAALLDEAPLILSQLRNSVASLYQEMGGKVIGSTVSVAKDRMHQILANILGLLPLCEAGAQPSTLRRLSLCRPRGCRGLRQ